MLFYIFIFCIMIEKTEKIVYSLKDKFLSLENEKRICSRQFSSRILTPWLLLWLLSIFLIFPTLSSIAWAMSISFIFYMPIVYMLIYYSIFLFFAPKLIIKRCHDFNNNWIMIKNIFLWLFITFIITSLLLIYLIVDLSFLYNFSNIIIILSNLSKAWLVIIGLYLLFRPWTKWKNDYWDDTNNVKIGLMW